jgi:copper chaperone CopZ
MLQQGLKIFVILLLLLRTSVVNSFAQIQQATLGINGLTCSQCSRSVEMQLKKLNFVHSIQMDLEGTKANLTFKSHNAVDYKALAYAVVKAGFSVRFLQIQINKQDIHLSDDNCFTIDNNTFGIINPNKELPEKGNYIFTGKLFGQKTNNSITAICNTASLNTVYSLQLK